jgi:hypothetical protein
MHLGEGKAEIRFMDSVERDDYRKYLVTRSWHMEGSDPFLIDDILYGGWREALSLLAVTTRNSGVRM